MEYSKQCRCGKVATKVVNINAAGVWIDCECRSTLFIPHTKFSRKVTESESKIKLSDKAFNEFTDLLSNTEEPSDSLKDAMKEYVKNKESDEGDSK